MKSPGGSAIALLPAFCLREPQSGPSCLCYPPGPSHFPLPLQMSSGVSHCLCPRRQTKSYIYLGRRGGRGVLKLNALEQQETMEGNMETPTSRKHRKQQGWQGTTPSCPSAPRPSGRCPNFSSCFLGGSSLTRGSD